MRLISAFIVLLLIIMLIGNWENESVFDAFLIAIYAFFLDSDLLKFERHELD